MTPLVALDWGTSSLRVARLNEQGEVLHEQASDQGILNVPADQFATVFIANCGRWARAEGTFYLISGMAGSRQGWQEAPYCPCPAGFDDLARALAWLPTPPGLAAGSRVAIVPGLCCEHDGVPDVMRGEEVQVFGALQMTGLDDATVVLPGTHSKWVTVRGRKIEHFRTFMTGEFYALLRQHSLLARTMAGDANTLDEAAFDLGVDRALNGDSLLATAFSARTLALFDRMSATALSSYLSGLVIGEELRTRSDPGAAVLVVGAPALTQRYARALARCGMSARCIDSRATWQGLWAVARQLGDLI
ncbi:MAG: 2-dehydro-3-deoxygalactonokinase [Ramlibacter sp.]|nr:2-dehydro-3-deoxygalactonokinase [Ramlibacter sp.]